MSAETATLPKRTPDLRRVLKFGDSDGFSDAMLELMENDALRAEYSANALKKVSEEFDLRKLALDVFETYK